MTWKQVTRWESLHRDESGAPKLVRFRGRPDDLSPRARFKSWLGGAPRPNPRRSDPERASRRHRPPHLTASAGRRTRLTRRISPRQALSRLTATTGTSTATARRSAT